MASKQVEKSVAAILYPDKIIIETRNQRDQYSWYSTDDLSILPTDAPDTAIGEAVLNHLALSKVELVDAATLQKQWESYKKKAKFKTEKSTIENAKCLSVYMSSKKIRIEPKKTMLSKRAFYNLPESIVEMDITSDAAKMGQYIRDSWQKCIISD